MTRRSGLTTSQVSGLKWRLERDGTGIDAVRQIAADYGTSTKTVRRIANGYIYAHVRAIEPRGAETG